MPPYSEESIGVNVASASFLLPPNYHRPTGTPWTRISMVMLGMSIIQCFAGIYIYIGVSQAGVFFICFLAYAILSLAFMILRAKYGLAWFGIGALLYCIWLSVLTWQSVSSKDYVRVCFDFSMTSFEFLAFCLSFSRFHELGGFILCCGPPSRDWKGRLLVGDENQIRRTTNERRNNGEEEEEEDPTMEPESERYLDQTLLANQHYLGMPQSQQQHHYIPGRGQPQQSTSPQSDIFPAEPTSSVSSASNSYLNTVGRGELLYSHLGGGGGSSVPPRPSLSDGSVYDGAFKLAPVLADSRNLQIHRDQQRQALSRDSSFNGNSQ